MSIQGINKCKYLDQCQQCPRISYTSEEFRTAHWDVYKTHEKHFKILTCIHQQPLSPHPFTTKDLAKATSWLQGKFINQYPLQSHSLTHNHNTCIIYSVTFLKQCTDHKCTMRTAHKSQLYFHAFTQFRTPFLHNQI